MTSNDAGASSEPAWFRFARTVLVAEASRRRPDGDPVTSEVGSDTLGVDLDDARGALHGVSAEGPFDVLVANAGLDASATEVLAVLAGAEVDAGLRDLVAVIHGDGHRRRVTLGLLRSIFGPGHPGPVLVGRGSALHRCAFVEVHPDGPWADHQVMVDAGIVWALVGGEAPDSALPLGAELVTDDADDQPGSSPRSIADLVISNGRDRIRRRQAGARAGYPDRYLCVAAPTEDGHWATIVREATITGSGLIVEIGSELSGLGRGWIERATHLTWVVSAETGPALAELPRRRWLHVEGSDVEPTDSEWAAAFGPDAPRRHRLTADQVDRVGAAFRRAHTEFEPGSDDSDAIARDIDAAVRRLSSGGLEQLTTRISPQRTWDDVIVSPDRLDLLQGIVERYRNGHRVYDEWGFAPTPSRGLVALFSGPSGTGKTLTAEVIAGDLGLDMFKLDLSSVVSKYIGETEQNLERIFDAASAGNMVLFFDEADALFGKRSEVRDSRDRYANLEVSYLLQRLETYDGLVIMATNLEKNIDDAFLRRIHTRVQFATPGVDERRAIWRHHLPATAPRDAVDFDWLAEAFELSGGVIRNAAVQAAFEAARDDGAIEMRHLVAGIAAELRKSGRLLNEADFGEYSEHLTR